MAKQNVRSAIITDEQENWIVENKINFSAFVRKALNDEIKKQKK